MSKRRHMDTAIKPGLEDTNLNDLVHDPNGKPSINATEAQAALNADKERRGKEMAEVLKRECERLNCDLIAVCEIVGNQTSTALRIQPR